MHSSIAVESRQPNVISFPARLESEPFARVTAGDLHLIPSTAALRVFAVLSMHAGASGFCWPTIARICTQADVGQRWCYRILRQLTDLGLLERSDQNGRYGWVVNHSNPGLEARGESKATLVCTPPPYIIEKKNKIYMGATMTTKVTNLSRAGDDEGSENLKHPLPVSKSSPRRQALLTLGQFFTAVTKQRVQTYQGSQDMRILGSLWDEYGEEAREVIEQAYTARDSLANDRFPKFTIHTVAFFAKFKYVSAPKTDLAKLIGSNTSHGILDEPNLAAACIVYGVRESELFGQLPREVAQRVSDKVAFIRARKRERTPNQVSEQDVS